MLSSYFSRAFVNRETRHVSAILFLFVRNEQHLDVGRLLKFSAS